MTERTRQEKDNQMSSINEYSDEINDEQEEIEYPLDGFSNAVSYKKTYHPHAEYDFSDDYNRRIGLWEGPSQQYEEYKPEDEYERSMDNREEYSAGAEGNKPSWQWEEREKEASHPWHRKEIKEKKEDSIISRKKSKFRVCTNCGTTTTPAWRRSTSNKILLCNACGLYQRLHGSDRPFSVTPEGKTKAIKNNIEKGVCRGCGISQTPLWKRGHNNEWLCSSCGLLYSRRGRNEEYAQEWPGYTQEAAWKYNEEYREYPDWQPQEREREMQYSYEDKNLEDEYFEDDARFRGYSGYYSQDK